jgi:hypothetical protein
MAIVNTAYSVCLWLGGALQGRALLRDLRADAHVDIGLLRRAVPPHVVRHLRLRYCQPRRRRLLP